MHAPLVDSFGKTFPTKKKGGSLKFPSKKFQKF
jgi:hypothetical protein